MQLVGHVPYNLAPSISRNVITVNKALAKVISEKVNRGATHGLEIPCEYHFYGPKPYIDKMKKLVLTTSGLA